MKVIAQRPGQYLLAESDDADLASIFDADRGQLFAPLPTQSITARGYWEPPTIEFSDIETLVQTAKGREPGAPRHKGQFAARVGGGVQGQARAERRRRAREYAKLSATARAFRDVYDTIRSAVVEFLDTLKDVVEDIELVAFGNAIRVGSTWASFEHHIKHKYKLDPEEVVIHAIIEYPHIAEIVHKAAEAATHVLPHIFKGREPDAPREHGRFAPTGARTDIDAQKPQAVRDALSVYEDATWGLDVEVAHVVAADGTKLIERKGATNHVEFSKDEITQWADAVLTHNHPSGRSLSLQDVVLAGRANLAEIRAVGEVRDASEFIQAGRHLFSLRRPDGGWPSETDLVALYALANTAVYTDLRGRIHQKELTPAQADQIHHHMVWSEVARRSPELSLYRAVRDE